jgi:hypothetical protein
MPGPCSPAVRYVPCLALVLAGKIMTKQTDSTCNDVSNITTICLHSDYEHNKFINEQTPAGRVASIHSHTFRRLA